MRLALTILTIFISNLLLPQGGFKRQFKLPSAVNNFATGIYQKHDGNYIAGGIVVDTLQGYSCNRLAIMGLDTNGQLQWTKKYGNYKFEYFSGGLATPWFYFDGSFLYHTGVVRDSLNKYYGVLMKINLNGDTLWQKTYKDTVQQVCTQRVTKSVDGALLLSGYCLDPININNPVLIIKVDSMGGELWRKKINKVFPNDHDGKAILQDSLSKKIVVVGYQSIGNAAGWWFYDNVLILDSLGNKLAQHNFAGSDGGALTDLIQCKDGKFVAVGYKVFPQTIGGTNLRKAFAVKFDVDTPNPPIWRFSFDKLVLNNIFTAINELDNGDMMIGGSIDTMVLHNMHDNGLVRLTRIDKNGSIKWNNYYNYKTNASNVDNSMALGSLNRTADKGYVAAIGIANNPSPNPFFFVKFDSTGCDSTPIYCQMMAELGLDEFKAQNPRLKAYPNPAGNQVSFDLEGGIDHAELFIFNVLGELVLHVPAYATESPLSLEKFKQGLYSYRLRARGENYSGKFLKE